MRFEKLQSDDLPLPTASDILSRLVIKPHAKTRFKQRASSKNPLTLKFLWSIIDQIHLTRESPSWRKPPQSVEDNPDLYLLFDFNWQDGVIDQGCLLIVTEHNPPKEEQYIARTFICKQSNNPKYNLALPELSKKILNKIALIERCSLKEAEDKLSTQPTNKKPAWLKNNWLKDKQVDSWLHGTHWALSLKREEIGSRSKYNYLFADFYDLTQLKKDQSRSRYQKRHQG